MRKLLLLTVVTLFLLLPVGRKADVAAAPVPETCQQCTDRAYLLAVQAEQFCQNQPGGGGGDCAWVFQDVYCSQVNANCVGQSCGPQVPFTCRDY
jgi:hypothetical protein